MRRSEVIIGALKLCTVSVEVADIEYVRILYSSMLYCSVGTVIDLSVIIGG